ncbi:MAG: MFS transporter [Allosphingosinicella sp.]
MERSEPSTQAPASWIAIGSLAVGAFALVTSEFLPVGLLPDIARDLGVTTGQAGLMVTLPGILAAVAAPLSIHYAGRMERRRALLILLALLVVSNLLVAVSGSFWLLLLGRALLGIAIGGFWTIAGAPGPRLRPGPEGVRAAAVILGGVSLGTVAGLPAGALLGELFGWRYAFGASALLAAGAIGALLALLPAVPAQASAGLRDMAALLRQRSTRTALLAASIMYTGTFGAYTYIAPFLSERSGISGQLLSAVLLANGAAGFVGNMFGGWLSGPSPYRSVLATAAIASASILLLPILGSAATLAIALVTIWGFSLGMQAISLQSWLQGEAPDRREAMQALFVCLSQAAIGLGALTGGLVVDRYGVSGAMLWGGFASLATLAIVVARPRSISQRHQIGLCEA